MNKKELSQKLDGFVASLDDTHEDEWWGTPQRVAKGFVDDLKVFLGLAPDTEARIAELEAEIKRLRSKK